MKTEQLMNERLLQHLKETLVGCSVKPLPPLCVVLVFQMQKFKDFTEGPGLPCTRHCAQKYQRDRVFSKIISIMDGWIETATKKIFFLSPLAI